MESFFKHNNSSFSDALIVEAKGLNILNDAIERTQNKYIKIPKVINVKENELELQKIDATISTKESSRNFAIGLALLHRCFEEDFGFVDDNYIGLSKQKNVLTSNWGEFFVSHRLEYQLELIKDLKVKERFQNTLENSRKNIIDFLNSSVDKPSLIHGDLWSGNVLSTEDVTYLIDPSVYYADREVDIAMTRMFSGFDEEFYKYYNKTFPLSNEYNEKEYIYNLYHYLNHYNLFGSAYLSDCISGFNFIKSIK